MQYITYICVAFKKAYDLYRRVFCGDNVIEIVMSFENVTNINNL
jgi:hypothetical protein